MCQLRAVGLCTRSRGHLWLCWNRRPRPHQQEQDKSGADLVLNKIRYFLLKHPWACVGNQVDLLARSTMDEQSPPPATPLYSPTNTGSSQSVQTLSSLSAEDPNRPSVRTSASGHVTLVFPPILRNTARASNLTAGPPFVELPTADLVPPSSSAASSGESRARVAIRSSEPAPLRLITDDALSTLLGPAANRRRNRGEVPDTLEGWVESSKQTIWSGARRDCSPDKSQGL